MATYLEIAQDVARESGTVPTIGNPTTVASQTGRLKRIVEWVKDAWRDLQRSEATWLWLYTEFSGETTASTQRYTAAAMGISTRFSRWVPIDHDRAEAFTIYKTADGQSTETFLRFEDWHAFRRKYLVGESATTTGKPTVFTVDQDRKLVFYPIPDAAYTVRGLYYKSPQILSDDSDTPECPEEFHDAIKWKALSYLGLYDESPNQVPVWEGNLRMVMGELQAHQLPLIHKPEPLA